MILRILLFAGIILTALGGQAQQSEYELEYIRRLGIKKRIGNRAFIQNGQAGERCVKTIEDFDPTGHVTRYVDHRKCKEVYSIFNYQYDMTGKMIAGNMQFVTISKELTPFEFEYDDVGRVTSKILSKPDKGLYQNEHVTYNKDGNIERIDFLDKEGKVMIGFGTIVHEFKDGRVSGFNFHLPQTKSTSRVEYIYDAEGRLLESQWYNEGRMTQTVTYEYEYF